MTVFGALMDIDENSSQNHFSSRKFPFEGEFLHDKYLRVRFAAVKIVDFQALFRLDQLFFNQNFCIFLTNYSFHNGLNVYLIIFFFEKIRGYRDKGH